MTSGRRLIILGIRGIPAAHGGFETFAQRLAPYLRDCGWRVTVYCQGSSSGRREEDQWEGIHRIHIPVQREGAAGTVEFDIKCIRDVARLDGTILTLGYNTGFLSTWLRMQGRRNLINMDGIEWKRAKYGVGPRAYLWLNEWLAASAGNDLIADHPKIADHLARRVSRDKIHIIPYGADRIDTADPDLLAPFGVEPNRFLTIIARPEPENSVLEMVQAFSAKPRGAKLLVLGKYLRSHAYQSKVLDSAGPEVIFPGAIYEKPVVDAMRYYSLAYLHGHRVGGTNPSLVEALGAGNAVIAHDNMFNRWVAGAAGLYFTDVDTCERHITRVLGGGETREVLRAAAVARWEEDFTWPKILGDYRVILEG